MDSEARCNGYKYEKKPNILIPHYYYSGDLPIEIIVSDLKYIESQITQRDKNSLAFYKILEHIINKLADDNYLCRYYHYEPYLVDEELIFMLLPILDNIVNRISSNLFFRKLKEEIEEDLNVIIHYPSVEDPINDSS